MDEEKLAEIEIENRKWKNRRRIAIFTMALITSMVLATFTSVFFLDKDVFDNLADFMYWTIFALISLPAAYMGLSTLADLKSGFKK